MEVRGILSLRFPIYLIICQFQKWNFAVFIIFESETLLGINLGNVASIPG